jgi:hypothetical protein
MAKPIPKRRGRRSFIYSHQAAPGIECFEVFKLKVGKEKIIFNKSIPERELFPSAESIGKWGWTCKSLIEALEKFNLLEKEN